MRLCGTLYDSFRGLIFFACFRVSSLEQYGIRDCQDIAFPSYSSYLTVIFLFCSSGRVRVGLVLFAGLFLGKVL